MKVGDFITVTYKKGPHCVTDYVCKINKIIESGAGTFYCFNSPTPDLGNPNWYQDQQWFLGTPHVTLRMSGDFLKPRKVINA